MSAEDRLLRLEQDVKRIFDDIEDLRGDMRSRDKSTKTAIANLALIMEQAQKAMNALIESVKV